MPCPPSLSVGGEEWTQWIMSRSKNTDLYMAASHYKRPKQIVNNQETYKAVRKSVADAQVAKKAVNASIRAPPPGFQGRNFVYHQASQRSLGR